MPTKPLTVLSFGGGQDSTTILLKLIYSSIFWNKYVGERDLIVVMSDTGNEYPFTYENVTKCGDLCDQHGIPFFFLKASDGFHTAAWQTLLGIQCREPGSKFKESAVMLNTRSCSDKLKLIPIYKFLDEYINEKYRYGFPIGKTRGCGKKAITEYGKTMDLKVMLGFAKGEEKRMNSSEKIQAKEKPLVNKRTGDRNWRAAITRSYPLIDEGMNRSDCQTWLAKMGFGEVMPSNCMLCPYQSGTELIWLARNYPEMWAKWVAIEKRKLARFEGTKKNHGVKLTGTLEDHLASAEKKFGHLTPAEIWEHKKSHGCQTNAF